MYYTKYSLSRAQTAGKEKNPLCQPNDDMNDTISAATFFGAHHRHYRSRILLQEQLNIPVAKKLAEGAQTGVWEGADHLSRRMSPLRAAY